MAKLLKGAPVAAALTEKLQARTMMLKEQGITPTLAIVRVGERADDLSYERGILKRAEKIGLGVRKFVLPDDCSQEALLDVIHEVNKRNDLHGCLMFRPLPAHLNETSVCSKPLDIYSHTANAYPQLVFICPHCANRVVSVKRTS